MVVLPASGWGDDGKGTAFLYFFLNSHKFSFFDSLFLVVSVAKNDVYIGLYYSFQLFIISDFGEFSIAHLTKRQARAQIAPDFSFSTVSWTRYQREPEPVKEWRTQEDTLAIESIRDKRGILTNHNFHRHLINPN